VPNPASAPVNVTARVPELASNRPGVELIAVMIPASAVAARAPTAIAAHTVNGRIRCRLMSFS
jgi:hypothetical protein